MVFDVDGAPVSAYANKLYHELRKYVESTATPAYDERELHLNPAVYPEPVTESVVRVKHTDGRTAITSVTYYEDWGGERWECRWGRHPNPHNDREHFHYPPNPEENSDPKAYDAEYGQDVLMVVVPAEFIEARIEDLFATGDPAYPSAYTWDNEYQPDRYARPEQR